MVLVIFLSAFLGGTLLMRLWSGNNRLVFDGVAVAWSVAAEPDVWTDGSLVQNKVSGATSAGAGCFTCRCSRLWANWRWGHLDEDVGDDAALSACRGCCSVPGPLQSVQRAEFWCVIVALQGNDGVHLGVDNHGVVRHVAASWMARLLLVLQSWLRMVVLFCSWEGCWTRFEFLKLRVMLMRPWFELGVLVILIDQEIMGRMRLLLFAEGGCIGGPLMLDVIILGFVLVGARLLSACIGFYCHCQDCCQS